MAEPLLAVSGLTIGFGPPPDTFVAVRDLSFTLEKGETLAIVGESGSGKSVTSLALMGLLPKPGGRALAGRALFEGRDLLALDQRALGKLRGDRITMIFQEPMTCLNPVLSIGRQMTEGLVVHRGLSEKAASARAIEMLRLVGLGEPEARLRQYPHELSGGQRQRVMIAIAMAMEPGILIADEPTTALDVTVQAQILDLMRDLQRRFGTSILLITHDMGVVAEMADRVVVMRRGRKVEDGPVGAVFEHPKAAYTKALLAAVPRISVDGLAGAGTSAAPILEVEAVSKSFAGRFGWFRPRSRPVKAIDDVSFKLLPGETLALVGESGSGKSTTGRAVLRLLDVDAGRIHFEGKDITHLAGNRLRALRRRLQTIFQDPYASLNPRLSAGRLVAEPLVVHDLARGRELEDRIAVLFRRVGLEPEMMRRYPHEFSGGQRQRLCIARALAVGPSVIVADEPTSALDVSIQAQVLELMQELQAALGVAYLFISHDMGVVSHVSHRVAVMYRGRIVELGPTPEVLGAPRHPYTKALLAAVPIPDPRARGTKLRVRPPASVPAGPLVEVAPGHLVAEAA